MDIKKIRYKLQIYVFLVIFTPPRVYLIYNRQFLIDDDIRDMPQINVNRIIHCLK